MSDDDVARIYSIADRGLERAREIYAKTFKRAVNDPSIMVELEERFKARSTDAEVVELPSELVLALLLRPGGRGLSRGRPPAGKWEKRFNELAVRVARRLKAEGLTAEEAALEAKRKVKCRISDATILDRISRPGRTSSGK